MRHSTRAIRATYKKKCEDKMRIDLYNMDAKELATYLGLAERKADLILTDPPYNIADKNKLTKVGNTIASTQNAWGNDFKDRWDTIDEYKDWLLDIVNQYIPLLNDTGSLILFLDRTYTGLFVYEIEKLGLTFRNKIYFEKINPLPHIRKTNYRSCMEEAIWFTKSKQYTFNFGEQNEMKQVYRGAIGTKQTKHPTEKYEWMVSPLIKNHSNAGDTVIDPFFGSGTVPVVCKALDRQFIGSEINDAFVSMAHARLGNYHIAMDTGDGNNQTVLNIVTQ